MGLFDNAKTSVTAGIGSLFNRPAIKQTDLSIHLDADPGYFYELKDGDNNPVGHALFKTRVPRGSLSLGLKIPMNCMFECHWLMRDRERVGWSFVSQFQVENHGGYLLTYISKGAGKATTVDTLVKTDDMIVYNYPNRGSLIISPRVNEDIAGVLEEQ